MGNRDDFTLVVDRHHVWRRRWFQYQYADRDEQEGNEASGNLEDQPETGICLPYNLVLEYRVETGSHLSPLP